MEFAFTRQALNRVKLLNPARGRPLAALLLFLALLSCHRQPVPVVEASWRIGLGAIALDMDPAGKRLAVACRRSNDVWILDIKDGKALARIDALPRPRHVLFHPDGESYFVPEGLSSVAQVRLRDLRVARRFKPIAKVSLLAYEAASARLLGGHQGQPTLGIYRLKDLHLENTVAVGGQVKAVQVGQGKAWVLCNRADALVQVSLADLSVRAAAATGPDPRAMALRERQDRAWIACRGREGEVAALALPSPVTALQELGSLSTLAQSGESVDPDAETEVSPVEDAAGADDEAEDAALVKNFEGGGIAVVRLSDVRRVDFIPVEGGPIALALGPSGRQVAVACDDKTLKIVDLEKRAVVSVLNLKSRPGAMRPAADRALLWLALADEKTLLVVRPGRGW